MEIERMSREELADLVAGEVKAIRDTLQQALAERSVGAVVPLVESQVRLLTFLCGENLTTETPA